MNHEEFGRLARATLEDLEPQKTYEGRLLTLASVLWHVDAQAREEVRRTDTGSSTRLGDTPGWQECYEIYKARCAATKEAAQAAPAPKMTEKDMSDVTPTTQEVEHAGRLAARDIEHLISSAPGPMTACFRRLATITASAHLACQWGCFSDAAPMMRWCAGVLATLRSHWSSKDQSGQNRLEADCVLAIVASIATEQGYATLATGLTRRLTAEFGAIARAAARLEGVPEADPIFAGSEAMVDTIRGMDQPTAEAAVRDLAGALDLRGHERRTRTPVEPSGSNSTLAAPRMEESPCRTAKKGSRRRPNTTPGPG